MLRFCDGFDSYGSSTDLIKKWSGGVDSSWTWGSTAGRFGGPGVSNAGAAAGKFIRSPLGLASVANQSVVAIGFWLKISANPAAATQLLQILYSSAAVAYDMQVTTAGKLATYNAGGGVCQTSIAAVCDNAWHWVETTWFQAGAGQVTTWMWIDNVTQGNGTSSGGTGAADSFQLGSIAGVTVSIDDVVWYDSNGGAPVAASGSGQLNSRQIVTTRPANDFAIGFSTTSSGSTHYNLLNEVNPDGDSSYVQDGTVGDQDLFTMGTIGGSPSNFSAVMTNVYCENVTGGFINIAGVCKSGIAAQNVTTAVVTPAAYNHVQFSFGVDPNTNAPWTQAGINAAVFGFRNA